MENKNHPSDEKNYHTIYFALLLVMAIFYAVYEISSIYSDLSEFDSSTNLLSTIPSGLPYYERALHILLIIFIFIPSLCLLWMNQSMKNRKNGKKDVQGNTGKQYGFGFMCLGLFLILEIAFRLLIRVDLFEVSYTFFYLMGGSGFPSESGEIAYFYSVHILYPVILILSILLYIYGIHSVRKLGAEELVSFKTERRVDKIRIGVILVAFFISFCWFYFISEKVSLDFQFSFLYYIDYSEISYSDFSFESEPWYTPIKVYRLFSISYENSSFSMFFPRIILPVMILKVLSIYKQEMRLEDIIKRKNTNKIIEIIIFMIYFSGLYSMITILPPFIIGPINVLVSLEHLIPWFPYVLVPLYIIKIWKIYKARKRIQENLDKRLDVDVVLHRHQDIMQKMTEGQSDMEAHSHGEI